MPRLHIILILSLLLTNCGMLGVNSGFRPDPTVEAEIIGQQPVILPQLQPLALDDTMLAYLDQHIPPGTQGWDLVNRLQELLFSPDYLAIQYDDTANFTARQTFAERRANCLSLVNLYIALARHYGLSVNYQTVQVRPIWNRRGELVVVSEHINAIGRVGPSGRYILDFTPEVRLQRQTDQLISDEQALALFYNNLAVDHLVQEQLEEALQYFRYALTVDPELAMAWNNLGSVWSRLDRDDLAEYSYLKAAWLDRTSASAYNNLVRFYSQQGDTEKAARYRRAVDSYNQRNPYYHYMLGNLAYEDAEYDKARQHFERAIQRYDLEPDFYLALGVTYRELGDEERFTELAQLSVALRELGDQAYRADQQQVRRIDTTSVLRSTSRGFSIQFVD